MTLPADKYLIEALTALKHSVQYLENVKRSPQSFPSLVPCRPRVLTLWRRSCRQLSPRPRLAGGNSADHDRGTDHVGEGFRLSVLLRFG